MGAKVIQVEAKGDPQGDFARHGFDYQNLHRNKRSITLDLKHSKGVEILKQLVARAVVALRFTGLFVDANAVSPAGLRGLVGQEAGPHSTASGELQRDPLNHQNPPVTLRHSPVM